MFLEFEDFIFDCESRGLSPKTLKSYKNITSLFLKYVKEELGIDKVSKIRHLHVKKYLQTKTKTDCTNNYINSIIKVLTAFFNFCEAEDYISENIMNRIPKVRGEKRIIETFTDLELKNMIDGFNFNTYFDARNKTIIATFFDTGVRCAELINIKPKDVKKNKLFIFGKGSKERFVPLSPILKRYLNKYNRMKEIYFNHKDEVDDNLFLSRTGRKLTIEAVENIFKKAREIADVREGIRCSPHTARHTYAVNMLRTHDIYQVASLLGHSSVKVTERYLQSLTNEKIVEEGMINSPLMNLKGGRK